MTPRTFGLAWLVPLCVSFAVGWAAVGLLAWSCAVPRRRLAPSPADRDRTGQLLGRLWRTGRNAADRTASRLRTGMDGRPTAFWAAYWTWTAAAVFNTVWPAALIPLGWPAWAVVPAVLLPGAVMNVPGYAFRWWTWKLRP